jgi:hypothetical protein
MISGTSVHCCDERRSRHFTDSAVIGANKFFTYRSGSPRTTF